jgi:hypothetical protein
MHPALLTLSKLRLRGSLRRLVRGLQSVRGILLASFGLLILFFLMLPTFAPEYQRSDPNTVRTLAPLAILAFCLMSLLTAPDKAINFQMAEVEFLFPGPFTRRQILLYKLLESAFVASYTALIFSLAFRYWSTWWIAGWIGIWLSLLFVQLLSMSVALLIQSIGERAYTLGRKLLLAALIVLVGAALWQMAPSIRGLSWLELALEFRETTSGRILLAPFEPFGRTIAAETLVPEFILWAAAALAVNAVLAAIVLWLDTNYLEAAAAASEKRYELISRARRGRTTALASRHSARLRLPVFPWLGGAGPLAWRQALHLVRASPRLMLVILFVAIFAGPGFFAFRSETTDITGPAIGMLIWLSFFVTAIIPTGFRADLDYMDWLKMLPLSGMAVTIGELLPAVLFITVLQGLILVGLAAFKIIPVSLLALAAAAALPANLLFLTTENLLFLWYPARQTPMGPGDPQFMGRQVLMMFLRMLLIAAAVGVAAGVMGLAWWAGLQSWPILWVLGWCVLTIQGLALIPLVVIAFRRFDPSVDMPI